MRRLSFVALFLFPLSLVADTFAESAFLGPSGVTFQEKSHRVSISIDKNIATYTVTRTFTNTSKKSGELRLDVTPPYQASVSGLRVLRGEKWESASLYETSEAYDVYEKGKGSGLKAIIFKSNPWEVSISVGPFAARGEETFEYSYSVPMVQSGDKSYLTYPPKTNKGFVDPVITVSGDSTKSFGLHGQKASYNKEITITAREVTEGVSEAVSVLTVTNDATVSSGQVELSIAHTFSSEVGAYLLSPSGTKTMLISCATEGCSEEDEPNPEKMPLFLSKKASIKVGKKESSKGEWRLVMTDDTNYGDEDYGAIQQWTLTLNLSDGSAVKLTQSEPSVLPRSFMPGESAPSFAWLSFAAPSAAAGASYYSIPFADKTVLGVRWSIQQLTPRPKSPNLVFLLDASRSQQGEGILLQIQAIESILMQAKDAKVQFVSYARTAKAQTSSWLSAADAMQLLKELKKLPLANGSSLDLGLQEAAKLLSKESGLLIAFTDGGLLKSLSLKTMQGALSGISTKSTVHLVSVSQGGFAEPSIERMDYPYAPDGKKELYEDQKLGEVAKKYNGMYVGFSWHKKTTTAELARLTEHLLHPIFIDDLSTSPTPPGDRWSVRGYNLFDMSAQGGPRLANESGFSLVELPSDRMVDLKSLKIQGRLWQRSWTQPITEDKSLESYTRLAFFARTISFFGDRDAILKLAKAAGVVSDTTAYVLAGSPVEGSFFGGGGFGSLGCGRGSTGGYTDRKSTPVDVEKLIAKECKAKSPIKVEIDTSNGEVLDVRVIQGSSAETKCVVDAAWALELPFNEGEETTTITK